MMEALDEMLATEEARMEKLSRYPELTDRIAFCAGVISGLRQAKFLLIAQEA